MRFLLYSHDGLGLGHTRRHLAIARALADLASNASILVATGADEVSRLGLPARVEILKLPSLRKVANGEYASRRLRIPVPQIRQLRSSLLRAAVSSFRPQVVLVDKHPFGAGGEFYDSLETVRSYGGSCVLGFRDILDERTTVLGEWAQHNLHNRIAEFYDEVLVYGERAVFDPVTEYDFSDTLAQRTSFCGYVVNHEESDPTGEPLPIALEARQQQRPVVIATAGGGEDGYLLSQTFIHAAAGARWQGIVVSGPMTPENEQERLRESAVHAGVTFQTFIPGLSAHFWTLDALVCMGGYNTLVEAVSKGIPTVCVPRTEPRAEQLLRAQAFERLELLHTLRPDQLSPGSLRAEVDRALQTSRQDLLQRASARLRFDGARQAATHLLSLAGQSPVELVPQAIPAANSIAEVI